MFSRPVLWVLRFRLPTVDHFRKWSTTSGLGRLLSLIMSEVSGVNLKCCLTRLSVIKVEVTFQKESDARLKTLPSYMVDEVQVKRERTLKVVFFVQGLFQVFVSLQ